MCEQMVRLFVCRESHYTLDDALLLEIKLGDGSRKLSFILDAENRLPCLYCRLISGITLHLA